MWTRGEWDKPKSQNCGHVDIIHIDVKHANMFLKEQHGDSKEERQGDATDNSYQHNKDCTRQRIFPNQETRAQGKDKRETAKTKLVALSTQHQ